MLLTISTSFELNNMAGRVKVLGAFMLIGFLAGVVANLAYRPLYDFLTKIFPTLFTFEWVLSGIAGALLSLVIVVIWATLSPPR